MADSHNRTFYPYVEAAEIFELRPTELLRRALAGELMLVWEQVSWHPAGMRVISRLGDNQGRRLPPRYCSREFIRVGPPTLERELRRLARGEKPTGKLGILPDEFERYAATLKTSKTTTKRTTKRPSPKEAKSRHRLLFAMAIDGFDFDPTKKGNSAITRIVQVSREAGDEIDAETVLDVLYKAAVEIDDPCKSKGAHVLTWLRTTRTPAISERIKGLSLKVQYGLLLNMGRGGYGFDPSKKRNSATARIVESTGKVFGRPMDGDTVLKFLRAANEVADTGENKEAQPHSD